MSAVLEVDRVVPDDMAAANATDAAVVFAVVDGDDNATSTNAIDVYERYNTEVLETLAKPVFKTMALRRAVRSSSGVAEGGWSWIWWVAMVYWIIFLPNFGVIYQAILCPARENNFSVDCNQQQVSICYCDAWNNWIKQTATIATFTVFYALLAIIHIFCTTYSGNLVYYEHTRFILIILFMTLTVFTNGGIYEELSLEDNVGPITSFSTCLTLLLLVFIAYVIARCILPRCRAAMVQRWYDMTLDDHTANGLRGSYSRHGFFSWFFCCCEKRRQFRIIMQGESASLATSIEYENVLSSSHSPEGLSGRSRTGSSPLLAPHISSSSSVQIKESRWEVAHQRRDSAMSAPAASFSSLDDGHPVLLQWTDSTFFGEELLGCC